MASIKRIDHVAIAVRDCDQATAQYVKLLNAVHIRTEVLREKAGMVKVAYMQIGENVLSLVQSLEADGFINQHIDKHGEGRAILAAASRADVPIYVPAFTDSELGLDVAIFNHSRRRRGVHPARTVARWIKIFLSTAQ